VDQTKIYYSSDKNLSTVRIAQLLKEVSPDAIYLNSFFGFLDMKCLVLRRLGMFPDIPVILAPRGELSAGALSLRATKKRIYLGLVLCLGLYRGLVWHASSQAEATEIRRLFGEAADVRIAPNMPGAADSEMTEPRKITKEKGTLRLVFLSRIVPKKNLLQALTAVSSLEGDVCLDIYGTLPATSYWEESRRVIEKLPANIRVTYGGVLTHAQVNETLSRYHFLLLPTLGENFGHVILEAMTAGCPVIISDRTPWLGLAAKGAGWDLPLERADAWEKVLHECLDMDDIVYSRLRKTTFEFGKRFISDPEIARANFRVFSVNGEYSSVGAAEPFF
jgi:glycosyltransferase involved in cell wall biosynthesis